MTQKIEAVIFDLGRVLVNIDLEPLRKKLSPSAGESGGGDLIQKVRESDLIPQLNSGKISLAQFHQTLCIRYGFDWSFDFFHQAWCSIFYPSPDMEALVRDLHGRIPLGLLSDTDLSHWTYIRRHYPFVEVFQKPVLSFQAGVCKPDPAIYRAAAQSVGLPPDRCFYTDDLPGNIEGARAVGMSDVLFQNADQIRRELKNFGIF